MRILVVHPGADMSTADVHSGLIDALQFRGHTVYDYALNSRIERSGAWLTYCWRKGGKQLEQPSAADILYHSGESLIARALRVMPDIVLVTSAMYVHPDIFVLMHRAGLPVFVVFTESPYDDEKQDRLLPFIRGAWTNERISVAPKVRYLPHAWNSFRHGIAAAPADDSVPSHDVVFVGTGFEERIELLSAVNWDGLDVGLYGSWDLLGSRHSLRKHLKGGYVTNEFANHLYSKAKIGLNLYRQSMGFGKGAPRVTDAESLNPRAYELAVSGCFTVSDYRAEIPEVFGDLVPTFRTPSELRLLIDRWLADESGRQAIRAALPHAVAQHTWLARVEQIERDLHDAGLRSAPQEPAATVTAVPA